MKKVTILGSTGSVGRQIIEVITNNFNYSNYYQIETIIADSNFALLAEQAKALNTKNVIINNEFYYQKLKEKLKEKIESPLNFLRSFSASNGFKSEASNFNFNNNINVMAGAQAVLDQIATLGPKDLIFIASNGIAALRPLLAALKNNVIVALANKESIVCGGAILREYLLNNSVININNFNNVSNINNNSNNVSYNEATNSGNNKLTKKSVSIWPLDSEHFSLQQLLIGKNIKDVEKLILTATGGPFFQKEKKTAAVGGITIEEAINHPIWKMGQRISINSATMMNKVLEVIEAHYLFNFPKNKIDILIHPEAIVHGLISLNNGTEHALIHQPSMKIGINNVLAELMKNETSAKEKISSFCEKNKLQQEQNNINSINNISNNFSLRGKKLTFFEGTVEAFPALEFLKTSHYITLNAANEIAVSAFLEKTISFQAIMKIVSNSLNNFYYREDQIKTVEDILELNRQAEEAALGYIKVLK